MASVGRSGGGEMETSVLEQQLKKCGKKSPQLIRDQIIFFLLFHDPQVKANFKNLKKN